MVCSELSLSAEDDHPTPSYLPGHIRLGSAQLILFAVFGALIAPTPAALGQSENPADSGTSGSSKTEICDGLNHSDPRQLSLSRAKSQSSDPGVSIAEESSSSQGSSDLTSDKVSLPELQRSSSDAQQQVLLCKRINGEMESMQPVESASEAKQDSTRGEIPADPTVTYADGKLTVNAQNVPLVDVLETIRVRAGISVEFPPEGMRGRVFDHVGPAPLREALMQLLYGSGFNYIIQTSSQDPQVVTKLILSAQGHVDSAGAPQLATQPLPEQEDSPTAYGAAGFKNEAASDSVQNDAPIEAVQPAPAASTITAPAASAITGVPAGFNLQKAAAESGKTPGQILDELQRRQIQMLEDQNAAQAQSQ